MVDLAEVSTVVVTFNSALIIARTLVALPHEAVARTVVVDNASSDGTAAAVRSLALPNTTVVALDDNVGFGAGCNAGLDHAPPSRYVLFLNPDAILERTDLERLVEYLDTHRGVALVAPRVFRYGEPLTSGGGPSTLGSSLRFLLPPWLGRRLPDNRLPPDHDRTGPVAYVEGACLLARREAVDAVGRFDERYFLFFEEQDLSRRLAASGYETHLVADARVEHLVGATRATVAYEARPAYVTSNRAYLRRWHGRAAAATFSIAVAASWGVRGVLGRVDRGAARAIVKAALGRSRA